MLSSMDGRTLVEQAQLVARERALIAYARGQTRMVNHGNEQLIALLEAVSALDGALVGNALIGGLAVGLVTGIPRATLDVDLAVPSTAKRETIVACMLAAGFRLTGDFAHSLNFRHANDEPVQLAMDAPFDDMIQRAQAVQVGEETIRVVLRDDLVAMKTRAANDPRRPKSKALRDQADLALLLGDVPDPDEGW